MSPTARPASTTAQWLLNVKGPSSRDPDSEDHPRVYGSLSERDLELPAEWLRDCVEKLLGQWASQEYWPEAIARNFEGKHLTWWYGLRARYPNSTVPWKVFAKEFLLEHQAYLTPSVVLQRLDGLEYTTLPVYIEQYRQILLKAPIETDISVFRFFFFRHLPSDAFDSLKAQELAKPSESMEELFRSATATLKTYESRKRKRVSAVTVE